MNAGATDLAKIEVSKKWTLLDMSAPVHESIGPALGSLRALA